MQNNAEKQEQIIHLKDGRTIFKTHNGFKSFVKTKQGEVTVITAAYYNKAKLLSITKLPVKVKTAKNAQLKLLPSLRATFA